MSAVSGAGMLTVTLPLALDILCVVRALAVDETLTGTSAPVDC